MSFQGDVAGIGLAELLQSLSRSRREGRLGLVSKEGLRCQLGVEAGVLHLLPEPEEDGDVWRQRARQAWALEFDERLDQVRTSEIARAHRVERVFSLLDSEGVHFRFDTDSLVGIDQALATAREQRSAGGAARAVDAPRASVVTCEGVPVEFLLLEYARLQDELDAQSEGFPFEDDDVVAPAGFADRSQAPQGFLAECDGHSNLAEISDRLAWPIRQTRLSLAAALLAGTVRLLEPDELLDLTLAELQAGRLQRGASRASAWLRRSPPGRLEPADAARIAAVWRQGGFLKLLNELSAGQIRTLVRRLHHVLEDPASELQRWRDARNLRKSDDILELRVIACRARVGLLEEEQRRIENGGEGEDPEEPDEEAGEGDEDAPAGDEAGAKLAPGSRRKPRGEMPSARELLDLARRLREKGQPRRALPLLRMAAHRQPTGAAARVELGAGLVEADRIDEGAPWILETARDLIEAGSPDKAIPALRSLLEFAPGLGEGRRLLHRARNLVMRRQIIRKHSVIALAVLAVLSVAAWVQIHFERALETKLAEVSTLLEDPVEAQERFDRYFSGDENERVSGMQQAITARRRDIETDLRSKWYTGYRAAQVECTLGDPKLGLRRALEITNPPVLITIDEPWPVVTDLFSGIAVRLKQELEAFGEVVLDVPAQLDQETDLARRIGELREILGGIELRGDAADLARELDAMHAALRERGEKRERDTSERARLDLMDQQELMLSAARAHQKAGSLDRALSVYERLLASDQTGRLARILTKEVQDLRERYDAFESARRLAQEGHHDRAVAALQRLDESERFALPWTLATFPAGALASLPDGSQRLTPFTLETRTDQSFEILLTLDGHREERVSISGPDDRFVWMTLSPERQWNTAGRVDALPVPVGQDHIVCDRSGRIARLGRGERTRWEVVVPSLGGIAHAPVFLSQRPGSMLVVTGEGDAWILQSKTGELEGPHALGSPPAMAPWPTEAGVAVRLRDGRLFEWVDRLMPAEIERGARVEQHEPQVSDGYSVTGALAILRAPSGSHRRLDSPWTDGSVEILDEVFRARYAPAEAGSPTAGGGFAVKRSGNWSFLAWEAPNGLLPQGRLWISDDAGLRAFVP